MLTDPVLQEIARQIAVKGTSGFAFCVDENQPSKVYFVPDLGLQAGVPDSCLVRLVQEMASIWEANWKGNSNLYFCKTGPTSQMEKGMLDFVYPRCQVKSSGVAPSRGTVLLLDLTQLGSTKFNPAAQLKYANLNFQHKADYLIHDNDNESKQKLTKVHRIYMMAAYALLNSPKLPKSYNVAAILVGANGQILSYGINESHRNYTCHAEVNALQGCLRNGKSIPAQSILYTTLQPCCMCAGMIDTCMQQGMVIYNVKDTHFNGNADHMKYVSTVPMHELGTFAKKLTTWKSGPVYKKIDKQPWTIHQERLHENLGTAINQDHRGIEYKIFNKYSIIQYLNKEGKKFIPHGKDAFVRKKDKYRVKKIGSNDYVHQAVDEAIAFLESLEVPVQTVQEERVIQMTTELTNQFPKRSHEFWQFVQGYLLAVCDKPDELSKIESSPQIFLEEMEVYFQNL